MVLHNINIKRVLKEGCSQKQRKHRHFKSLKNNNAKNYPNKKAKVFALILVRDGEVSCDAAPTVLDIELKEER